MRDLIEWTVLAAHAAALVIAALSVVAGQERDAILAVTAATVLLLGHTVFTGSGRSRGLNDLVGADTPDDPIRETLNIRVIDARRFCETHATTHAAAA